MRKVFIVLMSIPSVDDIFDSISEQILFLIAGTPIISTWQKEIFAQEYLRDEINLTL